MIDSEIEICAEINKRVLGLKIGMNRKAALKLILEKLIELEEQILKLKQDGISENT